MGDRDSIPKGTRPHPLGTGLERSDVRSGQPAGGGSASANANAQLPEPGTVIAGKYRIDQLLAQGGMGAVYSATHVVSDKRVALKWMLPALSLEPGASERFVREARATARIDHPNVVDIYDVGSDDGSVYLVMEFLRGETLHQRLERTSLSPRSTVALLMPALRGVAAAHAEGVIHRDLKPDNIFLCQSTDGEPREPKVLDFGISKIAVGAGQLDPALTQTGMVMGTPYYMSPEQARGLSQVDARTDVYAFGVILYEMLTRRRPFEADTYNQLMFKIATEDPAPIKSLNPAVDDTLVAVVERAMARDPGVRFQSIEALGAALEPHASGVRFRLSTALPPEPAMDSVTAPTLRVGAVSNNAPALRGGALSSAPAAVATTPAIERTVGDVRGTTRVSPVAILGTAAAVLVLLGVLLWRFVVSGLVASEPAAQAHPAATPAPAAAAPVPVQPVTATQAAVAPAVAIPQPEAEPVALPRGIEPSDEPVEKSAAAPAAPKAASASAPARASHSHTKQAAAAASPAAPSKPKLADDWDEHLRAPPPGQAAPSAGRIDDSDLR